MLAFLGVAQPLRKEDCLSLGEGAVEGNWEQEVGRRRERFPSTCESMRVGTDFHFGGNVGERKRERVHASDVSIFVLLLLL